MQIENNNDEILKVSLIPIDCTNGQVNELIDEKCYLSDVIVKEQREQQQQQQYDEGASHTTTTIEVPNITIIYLIRRAGCGGCKENGQIVSKIIKEYNDANKNNTISCFGIIKEINIDNNVSLLNFYKQYFTYSLYVDNQWKLYNFLGNGIISYYTLLINTPYALYRYYKKNIPNVLFGGDIYTLGGLLFYYNTTNKSSDSPILYTKYNEKYGEPFETTMIRSIIRNMIQHHTTNVTATENINNDTSTCTTTSVNSVDTSTNTI